MNEEKSTEPEVVVLSLEMDGKMGDTHVSSQDSTQKGSVETFHRQAYRRATRKFDFIVLPVFIVACES